MKNLAVYKKLVFHNDTNENKTAELLFIAGLILFAIICLPLLLMSWLAMLINNGLFGENLQIIPHDGWYSIDTSGYFLLRCKLVEVSSISEKVAAYFDSEPLVVYRTEPEITFFSGYFSHFKVERIDGIFVQKVFFDEKQEEVVSMPLYFFNYQTKEAEKIHELLGYHLETKGSTNDFTLTASGEHQDVEIRLVKS